MGKRKSNHNYPVFEVGQTVKLTRPILLYSDARLGIEYDPPHVLYDIGDEAEVIEIGSMGENTYKISFGDGTFVITRHAASLEVVTESEAQK